MKPNFAGTLEVAMHSSGNQLLAKSLWKCHCTCEVIGEGIGLIEFDNLH